MCFLKAYLKHSPPSLHLSIFQETWRWHTPSPALRLFKSYFFCLQGTKCSFGSEKRNDQGIHPSQKPTRLVGLALLLFLCSAALREQHYVLIWSSFQEKYIPERCFHVCHIMKEQVFLCRPGQQPALPTKHPAMCTSYGRGNNLQMASTHLTLEEYIHTVWQSAVCLNR